MPVVNRRTLRQRLGTEYLRDSLVSTTTGSWGATASLTVYDVKLADLSLTGEDMYQRSWLRTLTASTYIQDARIASFNVASGAFHCLVLNATTIASGTAYEVHSLLPPTEKDAALDRVVGMLREEKDLAIASVDGASVYSLGPEVLDVLDARAYAWPTASKGETAIRWWEVRPTATGQELRILPALGASDQLLLRAVTALTLGAADTATINLPLDDWLLSGAAARAYFLAEARAPAQEVARFRERRREMAAEFTRLSARFQPRVERTPKLDGWW